MQMCTAQPQSSQDNSHYMQCGDEFYSSSLKKKLVILVITHKLISKATSGAQLTGWETLLWEIHLEVESKDYEKF